MNSDTPAPAIDYAAVLADLESRRAQIDAAIAVIRPLVGSAASVPPGGVAPPTSAVISNHVTELRDDAFFSLSIPDAAKKYLSIRKRSATTPEIIAALRQGGQINASSENYEKTVGSVLNRAHATGAGIVRVKRGTWGLAEWYPNRSKKAQGED